MSEITKNLERVFFKNNKGMFAINMVLRMAIAAGDLVLSYMLKNIIDTAIAGDWSRFVKVVWVCGGAILFEAGCFFFMRYSFASFLRKGIMQYRHAVFQKIISHPLAQGEKDQSDAYLSALTNDVTTMETEYYENLFMAVVSIVAFVAAFIIMLKESWMLTGFAVGFMLLPVVVSIMTGNQLAVVEKKVSDKNADFVSMLRDCFNGFSTIKLFRIEDKTEQIFDKYNKSLEDTKYDKRIKARTIEMLSSVAYTVSQFGLMLVGGFLVINDKGVTVGMITLFLQMMNYLLQPLSVIPAFMAAKKSKHLLIEKIATILSVEESKPKETLEKRLQNGIRLQNVSYAYEDQYSILSDVSLTFERGKSYAIVGPSGCGKTTLLNLVAGNIRDYDGTISFDNTDIKSISVESLYRHIVFMQQKVFLFRDTILNNITLYRDMAAETIRCAIQKAGLEDLIQTVGLGYVYGESDSNLSGGEKQRIAIARSLLMDGEVLVMDEMTSALDRENSRRIMNAILALENKTKIMVTHNLDEEILRKVDEIIVMSEGKIVDQGSYDSLVQKGDVKYFL